MKMLLAYRHYPMSMAMYFKRAMKRLGHEVVTVGTYSGDDGSIPWPGSPKFPQYIDKPDIILPDSSSYSLKAVLLSNPNLKPDIVWSFDAGFRLIGTNPYGKTVLYGTDPHALNYEPYYKEYDYFFSAQKVNLPESAEWIPLAYDPAVHTCNNPIDEESRLIDVCFVGVMGTSSDPSNPYHHRYNGLKMLESNGCKVFAQTGLIFSECTFIYNKSKIAYNWSSSWDIPMRLFEGMAYGCAVLTNRLPFLHELGFVEDEDYVAFDSYEELAEKTKWLLQDDNWITIAKNGMRWLEGQTYDLRVKQMLKSMGCE